MAEDRERKTAGGVVTQAALDCGLAALGIGCLVTGKVALGFLTLILLAGLVGGEVVLRRGSDAAVLRFAIARPIFFGGWLIALASVIVASGTSLDWVLILPLGVVYIGLGVFLYAMYRRSRRDANPSD